MSMSSERRAMSTNTLESNVPHFEPNAAQRAQKQYDPADPQNRLVADELERRWKALSRLSTIILPELSRKPLSQPIATQSARQERAKVVAPDSSPIPKPRLERKQNLRAPSYTISKARSTGVPLQRNRSRDKCR